MILCVYDWDFNPVGMIEEYTTCSWVRRFRSRGECTLSVPYSAEALEILQVDNWLIQQNGTEAMVITTVTLSKDQTGADLINVTAYGLFQLLNRRVNNKEYEEVEMTPQEIIYTLIETNITQAKKQQRRLPYVQLNKRDKFAGLEKTEFSLEVYSRLGDAIEEQLSASEIGCVINTDIPGKKHTFDFLMPTDHTASGDSPIIFSVDYGTLGEQEFIHSHEQYANMAYVLSGDTEDESAVVRETSLAMYGDDLSGYARYEIGINASDIKFDDNWDKSDLSDLITKVDGGYVLPDDDVGIKRLRELGKRVTNKLLKRAEDELKNSYPEENTFTGKIVETDSLVYKTDWDLGDRVTCMYTRWGIAADLTITEIIEEYAKTGRTITVTFGEGTPDFRKTMCALVRRTV